MSSDQVSYVLASLGRANKNGYAWSVFPHEAGLLIDEIERLRAQRVLDNDELARAYDMGRDNERAATVAYLRSPGTSCDTGVLADAIERGEHRRVEGT